MDKLQQYADYLDVRDVVEEFNEWYTGYPTCWDIDEPFDTLLLETQEDTLNDFIFDKMNMGPDFQEWVKGWPYEQE